MTSEEEEEELQLTSQEPLMTSLLPPLSFWAIGHHLDCLMTLICY